MTAVIRGDDAIEIVPPGDLYGTGMLAGEVTACAARLERLFGPPEPVREGHSVRWAVLVEHPAGPPRMSGLPLAEVLLIARSATVLRFPSLESAYDIRTRRDGKWAASRVIATIRPWVITGRDGRRAGAERFTTGYAAIAALRRYPEGCDIAMDAWSSALT
jgi:hypothetical protein